MFLENVADQGCLTEQGQLAVWEQSAAKGSPAAKRFLDAAGHWARRIFSTTFGRPGRSFFDYFGGFGRSGTPARAEKSSCQAAVGRESPPDSERALDGRVENGIHDENKFFGFGTSPSPPTETLNRWMCVNTHTNYILYIICIYMYTHIHTRV